MTEQALPASREIAERDEAPGSLAELRTLGWWLALAESGDSTREAKGAAAALRFYFVRELGLPPLAANEVSMIKGHLYVGPKLLRAQAARKGYRVIRTPDSDADAVTAVVYGKDGVELGRTTFTMEDAKRAKLVKPNSAWETHPARMLWARAAKFAIDDYAPEVSLGLGTDDEAAEIIDEPFELKDPLDTVDIPFGEPDQVEQIELMDAIRDELGGEPEVEPD